ncbi:hypothetical protein GCM10023084_43710 [Streptomyces lacrimifluminis]|uniref:Uncharacterized protein n=1 Tax=Streptomyces lacrimifluminis TaxID=1500077 RepID=A0A917NMX1_9ACTN|nr:hypothetical protein GCM10012282_06300 [Streptomyces lacrimifluminis]
MAGPRVRSPGLGASGSDWVLPGTAEAAGAAGATFAGPASAGLAEAEARVVGRVNGSASAVAHTTPMEEERYPRMPLILDIAIHTCPTMN